MVGTIIYFRKRNKTTKFNDFMWVTFIMYCAVVASVTLFPIFTGDQLALMKPPGEVLTIKESTNLIPFKTLIPATQELLNIWADSTSFLAFIDSGGFYNYCRQIVGNVLLFMPLGIYLALLIKPINLMKVVSIAAVSAISIELIQLGYDLYCGWPQRNVNIDDAILNILGATIGYLIVVSIKNIKKLIHQ